MKTSWRSATASSFIIGLALTGHDSLAADIRPGVASVVRSTHAEAPLVVELQPGRTVSVLPGQELKAINIGDPAVADANVISADGGIAINGRMVGTTSLTAYDERGRVVAHMIIQVVGGNDVRDNPATARSEIRVRSLKNALDRSFLCSEGCTSIRTPAGSPRLTQSAGSGAPNLAGAALAVGALVGALANAQQEAGGAAASGAAPTVTAPARE